MNKKIITFLTIATFTACAIWAYRTYMPQPHLVVIIPSYNNINWYAKNLSMLAAQDYTNWHALYIDDCSPDGTGAAVEKYVQENNLGRKITVIKNQKRCGALANVYNAVHTLRNKDIVLIYDGDDWFAHERVLSVVADTYKNNNVWLTYGQYKEYPERNIGAVAQFPKQIIEHNAFRSYYWISSHLRTFYAGLFKQIAQKDLMYEGEFLAKTGDMAIMFPMLEMAGSRMKRMDEVLYVYNLDNPINDWKDNLDLVLKLERHVRSAPRYHRLKELPA